MHTVEITVEGKISAEKPQLMGGWTPTMTKITETKPAVVKLLKSVEKPVREFVSKLDSKIEIKEFTPETFSTQVVAGTNYNVIYKINPVQKMEVKFWKKLDGTVQVTGAS